MSTDFETQLRERLEQSTSGVTGTDALYDRAEARYRSHTRRRMAAGGIVTAVVVALGAVLGSSLLDQRPEPPIVRQPEPSQTASPGPDGEPGFVPTLVASQNLLDELGLPDSHPFRGAGWTLVRAYPTVRGTELGYDELVLEVDDADGRRHVVVLTQDEVIELASTTGPVDDVDLHGTILSNDGVEATRIIVSYIAADGPVVSLFEPSGTEHVVANGSTQLPGQVERVSVMQLASGPALFVALRDAKGIAGGYVLYDLGGNLVSVPWVATDADPDPCACDLRSMTASGSRVAWAKRDPDGTGSIVVVDPVAGSVLAEAEIARFADQDVFADVRLEFSGRHLIVNAIPRRYGDVAAIPRWYLDASTGEVQRFEHVHWGYISLMERREVEVVPPTYGTWRDAGTLPLAPNGLSWDLGEPVWTGEMAYSLASWAQPTGDSPWPIGLGLLRYDPIDESWSSLATPPGSGDLHWIDDRLVLLGQVIGATPDDPWRTWTYDVESDRWTEHARVPLELRTAGGYSTTWTGSELIVWGGLSIDWSDGAVGGSDRVRTYDDGAAFDPGSGRWRVIADAPLSPRGDHGAVWNGRRLIVFGGGHTANFEGEFYWDEFLHDAAVYDPATDTWTTIQSPGQLGPVVAADWTGTHVLTAGLNFIGDRTFGLVWDPVTGDATEIPEEPGFLNYRDDIDHEWVPELQRWVLWGGGCGEGCNATFPFGFLFDPVSLSWKMLNDFGDGTGYGSHAAWLGDRLLVVGGHDGSMGGVDGVRRAVPRLWFPPRD